MSTAESRSQSIDSNLQEPANIEDITDMDMEMDMDLELDSDENSNPLSSTASVNGSTSNGNRTHLNNSHSSSNSNNPQLLTTESLEKHRNAIASIAPILQDFVPVLSKSEFTSPQHDALSRTISNISALSINNNNNSFSIPHSLNSITDSLEHDSNETAIADSNPVSHSNSFTNEHHPSSPLKTTAVFPGDESSATTTNNNNNPTTTSNSLEQSHQINSSTSSTTSTYSLPKKSRTASISEPSGPKLPKIGTIGVCAMDNKVLSKPCRQILSRLMKNGEFETIIFGDKVILDEAIENWPTCDFLISFFSTGFPLDKAIKYVKLRKPYTINDLIMQRALWDRRICLDLLKACDVPTPKRLIISRDGGPMLDEDLKIKLKERLNLEYNEIPEPEWSMPDQDTLVVNGETLTKPFVEKPVDGEDHNVYIYYHSKNGGGGRKLFRKIGNKSSEFDSNLVNIRTNGSYIYEKFIDTDNFEDVKAYTIGVDFCHAETRKSPVVDGIVRRNTHGKELRYVTELSDEEKEMAKKVTLAFDQVICGFDLLRDNGKSYVIDVNGFSFVKDNNDYYDICAKILREKFIKAKQDKILLNQNSVNKNEVENEEKKQKWVFKGSVLVIRHADRTPKQKFKYSFKSPIFISLLKGYKEEIIIREVDDLKIVLKTVKVAIDQKLENIKKLKQLAMALEKKMNFPGTKIQLKPSLNEETNEIEKVQLIIKWGGEPTHSAIYQATDVGEQARQNIQLLNKDALKEIQVYTSSERRVVASAQLFTKSFLGLSKSQKLPDDFLQVRKDLLDDSNAAKDLMDKVKKKLKPLIRQGVEAPPHFSWPPKMPEPFIVIKRVVELMNYHKKIMEKNFETKNVDDFQQNWCCGEDPSLFRERWDKLFQEFISVEKVHPSKISELYDTMKYDALHNREFLQKVFINETNEGVKDLSSSLVNQYPVNILAMNNFKVPDNSTNLNEATPSQSSSSSSNASTYTAGSIGWILSGSNKNKKSSSTNTRGSVSGSSGGASPSSPVISKEKEREREERDSDSPFSNEKYALLRELYRLAKVLFDFICPQEYGIENNEKLDIGLLTSLPLARQILNDITSIRDTDKTATVVYFTKESHIYTLLNVLYESQIPMKIARNALPELDYLSQIVFELYESEDGSGDKKHSIRLSLSPGCHTQDPLDVQLDDKHYISCVRRINLTRHLDMELVSQKLKSRFSRVSLPKRFTPVNISSPLTEVKP